MVSVNPVIRVMFEFQNPPKANRLYGLGLRVWAIIGMKRFQFAAIEWVCLSPPRNFHLYIR